MDLISLIPDNLSELLRKILQFTASRRATLYQNIREMRAPGFVPQDMPVLEFAEVMNGAIAEHLLNQRLLFRDTQNIRFGESGMMSLSSVPDAHAEALLAVNPDEYLEHQVNKLLENSLNHKVAENLLTHKSNVLSAVSRSHAGPIQTGDNPLEDSRESEE